MIPLPNFKPVGLLHEHYMTPSRLIKHTKSQIALLYDLFVDTSLISILYRIESTKYLLVEILSICQVNVGNAFKY